MILTSYEKNRGEHPMEAIVTQFEKDLKENPRRFGLK